MWAASQVHTYIALFMSSRCIVSIHSIVVVVVVVDLVTSPTDLLDPPLKKGWDTGQLLHSNAGGLPRGTSSSSQRPTVQCGAQRGPDTPGEEYKRSLFGRPTPCRVFATHPPHCGPRPSGAPFWERGTDQSPAGASWLPHHKGGYCAGCKVGSEARTGYQEKVKPRAAEGKGGRMRPCR